MSLRILSTLCKTNLNFAHWYAFPFNVMSELIRNAFFFFSFPEKKRKEKLQNKGRFIKESCRTDPNSVMNLPMITYKERGNSLQSVGLFTVVKFVSNSQNANF